MEMDTDEAVDYILGDEPTEKLPQEPAGTKAAKKRTYTNRCRDCGAMFEGAFPGAKTCPACNSRRRSAGQKAGHERARLQVTSKSEESELQVSASELQQQPPEREPEDLSTDEITERLAEGVRREPGDVILAMYGAVRDVARSAGIQTRVLIETMYELDETLAHVRSV